MKLKDRGFTLTELLIVVVIIGILAAVVLPKYNKVLDTYKTAEAEQFMETVRNEQEVYYELDGAYKGAGKVESFPDSSGTFVSKNFTYTLGNDNISAAALNQEYTYTLKMKYDTGDICCSGLDCNKLNKQYAGC